MEMEVYRDIEGYEGLYQVSNLGNVKSLKRLIKKGRKCSTIIEKPDLIMKLKNHRSGYLCITLCKDGKRKMYQIHRLVALAFIPNPDKLPCINHKDENKTNNCVDNLEWCDRKYNNTYGNRIKKAIETYKINNQNGEYIFKGLLTKKIKGSSNAEKPVIQLSKDGIEIEKYKSLSEASRQTKINLGHIGECLKGKRNIAGGYIWKYL